MSYIDSCYHCENCGAWVLPGKISLIQDDYCPFCGSQLVKVSK